MAEWNRFDICEAYAVLEWDYGSGGWLQERPSNKRRMESTGVQLERLQFRPALDLGFDTLTENGKEIYLDRVIEWVLPIDEEQAHRLIEFYGADWLALRHPDTLVDCQAAIRSRSMFG